MCIFRLEWLKINLFSPYEDFIYRNIYNGVWCRFFDLVEITGVSGVSGARSGESFACLNK